MTRQTRPIIVGLAPTQNTNGPKIVGMAQGSQQGTPLVAGGGMTGYATKMTAPASQQVVPAGETFTKQTGGLGSAATPENVTKNQSMIQGYDLLKPQLSQLAQEAPTYLSLNGKLGKIKGDQIVSRIAQYFNPGGAVTDLAKAIGLDPDEYSSYHRFKTIIPNAIDNYMAARGLPSTDLNKSMVQSILEPAKGESGDAYAKRMNYELGQMQNYKDIAQQNLSKGFDLNPTSPGYQAGKSQPTDSDYVPPATSTPPTPPVPQGAPAPTAPMKTQVSQAISLAKQHYGQKWNSLTPDQKSNAVMNALPGMYPGNYSGEPGKLQAQNVANVKANQIYWPQY